MTVFNAHEQELVSQLAELQRTMPDVPLEELTFEQLTELQRVHANLAESIKKRTNAADCE